MTDASSPPAKGYEDEEALQWTLRMSEPEADWDGFVSWLEGGPDRSLRYDRAVMALSDAAEVVSRIPPTPIRAAMAADTKPFSPRSVPRWAGRLIAGGVAAALLGTVTSRVWDQEGESYTVEARPGSSRSIVLEDGSVIDLAGGSRVRLYRSRMRSASLEVGEALFRVRHDASHPFQVHAGGLSMTDLGTEFDVRLLAGDTRVEVSEGAVMIGAAGVTLRLDPGDAAELSDGRLRPRAVAKADVGSWRSGRLIYEGATLAAVAEDLSRHLGHPVTASSSVASRTFNGTLDGAAIRDDPSLLGDLLSVAVRADAGSWTLETRR